MAEGKQSEVVEPPHVVFVLTVRFRQRLSPGSKSRYASSSKQLRIVQAIPVPVSCSNVPFEGCSHYAGSVLL